MTDAKKEISPESRAQWDDFRERVRAAHPIADVIGRDTKLIATGKDQWKCLSPFRKEKTPSLYVYASQDRWHDFGTGEGGDVFAYVERRDNVDFPTALRTLAALANIDTPFNGAAGATPEQVEELVEQYRGRRSVRVLSTAIADYYHEALPSSVRRYLNTHYGIPNWYIDEQKIGWATGQAYEHFRAEGHSQHDLIRTGFFLKFNRPGDPDDSVVDFFKHRIVFPYWEGSHVAYAIARRYEPAVFEDVEHEKAKYKKLLTNNEKHPYVAACVRPDVLIIVEGVTDCIILAAHGYGTFSPITTRFRAKDNPKLVRMLSGYRGIVCICNDADVLADGREPGKEGALATAAALMRVGLDVRIVDLPRPDGVAKMDVNEFFASRIRDGIDPRPEFDAILAKAKRVPEFLITDSPDDLDPKQIEERLDLIAHSAGTMLPIERDMLAQKACRHFKVKRKLIDPIFERHVVTKEEAVVEITKEEPKALRAGADKLRGKVQEDIGFYFVETVYGDRDQISSFTLRPKKILVDEENREHLVCDIILEGGVVLAEDHVFKSTVWQSRREFLRALPFTAMQWTGSDDNVQGVLRTLRERTVPRMRATSVLGYHEVRGEPRFVTPQGTIAPHGWMTEPDICYVPDGSTLSKRLDYPRVSAEDVAALARTALPLLFKVNEPHIVWSVAGWFFSAFFKPRIMQSLGHFPSLNVYGTMGSGKTSLIRLFWRLHGAKASSETFSVTETDFVAAKNAAASNAVAMPHDEYKPQDMGRFKVERTHRSLRRGYTGETEERGRADQGVNSYPISAPMCIMGEAKIEHDPALAERIIFASPKKNTVEDPVAADAYVRLYTLPLNQLASPFIQWSLGVESGALLMRAREVTLDALATIKRKVPPRVLDNLISNTFGLLALDLWAASIGVELVELPFAECIRAVIDEILEGADASNAKDLVDELLENLSSLALQGILVEGIHFKWIDGRLHLALRVCLDAYAAHCRTTGREDRTNGIRAVRRVLAEKLTRPEGTYVVELAKLTSMGADIHARCVVIDPKKVPDTLDVNSFPMTTMHRWGGGRGPQPSPMELVAQWNTHKAKAEEN